MLMPPQEVTGSFTAITFIKPNLCAIVGESLISSTNLTSNIKSKQQRRVISLVQTQSKINYTSELSLINNCFCES